MKKYLSLLLELLNIEDKEPLLAIGEVIAHQTKRQLVVFHRLGFVFEAWYALLLEKLPLEEFLALGDITSSRTLWQPEQKSSLDILHSPKLLATLPAESMVLVDEVSFFALSQSEQTNIQQQLEKKDIVLLIC
ncbi:MAG: hypothetical protein LBP53_01930 [Candidatus Peribacteria bacterium]|jgi:hypothetical protein|nr:hypothetical protein [Candidatus Peribacteria bacterium]